MPFTFQSALQALYQLFPFFKVQEDFFKVPCGRIKAPPGRLKELLATSK